MSKWIQVNYDSNFFRVEKKLCLYKFILVFLQRGFFKHKNVPFAAPSFSILSLPTILIDASVLFFFFFSFGKIS